MWGLLDNCVVTPRYQQRSGLSMQEKCGQTNPALLNQDVMAHPRTTAPGLYIVTLSMFFSFNTAFFAVFYWITGPMYKAQQKQASRLLKPIDPRALACCIASWLCVFLCEPWCHSSIELSLSG